jgi:geranylgeranyl diphosphate synthase type I
VTAVAELVNVGPALRAAVDRLEPNTWKVAAYHFGWVDAAGRPSGSDVTGGGKGVRARLALLSARAAGAPAEVGLPGAVAVELLHNFSLVHDDVMDGDVQRRHRRTVWAVFGVPAAILAGSALQSLALEVVLDPPTPAGAAAADLLSKTIRALIGGQFEDLAFERRGSVTVAEAEEMAAGKTGALVVASAAVGAVLAGAGPETVAALEAYGDHVGLAFQLEDDLLGIWGDPAVTGKPALADLRARKKSLPVAAALATGGSAADRLREWLATPAPPPGQATEVDWEDLAELRAIADLVEQAGGRAWVAAEARRQVVLAEQALAGAPVEPAAAAEMVALARSLLGRSA